MNPVSRLKSPPSPAGRGPVPAQSPGPAPQGRPRAHLVADQHVDARGALAVQPVDVLRRDAVEAGDLLDQLQGSQLLQEDGMVHWRAEDRSFYRTSICFQRSPPTNSPPHPLKPRTSPDGLSDLAVLGASLEATRPVCGPAPGEKMPNCVLYPCFSLSWGIRVRWENTWIHPGPQDSCLVWGWRLEGERLAETCIF